MTHKHPAFDVLMFPRWDAALAWLLEQSAPAIGAEAANRLRDMVGDRALVTEEIPELVDKFYGKGTVAAGELALAWSMMLCSPRRPGSFRSVMPQLQAALDRSDLEDDADLRDRLRIWWRAARGDFVKAELSIFYLAETTRFDGAIVPGEEADDQPAPPKLAEDVTAKWFAAPFDGPTLVVMPKAKATKLHHNTKAFEAILDKALPLVVARNLDEARRRLGYEFPHAESALGGLFRDLREGDPVRLRPTLLVGPPGTGKSRLVRKFAAAIGIQHLHRYDGSAAGDNHFAGTSKSWSTTEPSVPARAVLASMTANPLVFVDELDKATPRGGFNGNLFDALTSFLERETAKRWRDVSLDAEVDLGMCSYIATANDASVLPEHIRDRFRILKVPAPRLVDLPLIAGAIVDEMMLEGDEWAAHAAPFAPDELQVMAKAWRAAGLSVRKLQKIVAATLEARDAHAMRH